MPTRIDHVIIAAPDLAQLEQAFTQLGFSITGGGTHPHLGTRNRIIILGESYIELLAIADVAKVSAALHERIANGAGWVGFALQSDDIAAEATAMRERGVDARGPTAGRLVAPEGATRSWRVVTVGSDDLWAAALPLPFLIQHDSEGERHQRELASGGDIAPHANGVMRLVGVTLSVTNLAAMGERYEQAFGLASVTPALDAAITYPLGQSGEWVRLVQPVNATANVALATGANTDMSVLVSVPDLAAIERAIWHAGFAATPQANALSVTLPGIHAELHFTAQHERKGEEGEK